MPGWYFCTCKPGYEKHHATGCQDIDECRLGTHSCHPSAECINTNGHFECHCPVDQLDLSPTKCRHSEPSNNFIIMIM